VEREFNLSHSAVQPDHNEIVAGRWVADEADGLSVEEGLAQELKLKLGDTLRFDIGGVMREGAHHHTAQGGLGFDARELLCAVPACADGRRAGHLHQRLPAPDTVAGHRVSTAS
jgi:hypothetical protein